MTLTVTSDHVIMLRLLVITLVVTSSSRAQDKEGFVWKSGTSLLCHLRA